MEELDIDDYIGNLQGENERLREKCEQAQAKLALQPCGHPVACIASSDDGTQWCEWCVDVGRAQSTEQELLKVTAERDALAAECAKLRAALGAISTVHDKFSHLDRLLTDQEFLGCDSAHMHLEEGHVLNRILWELWQAARQVAALDAGDKEG